MENSKAAAENALHMSLDQYISVNGIQDPNCLSVKKSNHYRNARFNRKNSDDEEPDDDDIEMSVQPSEYFDLDGEIPNVRSNQWRLMAPNTSADRPSGMPPLVSDKVLQSLRTRTALSSNEQQRQQIEYADRMDDQQQQPSSTTGGGGSANDMKIEFDNDSASSSTGGNRQRNRGGNGRWNYNHNNNNRGNNNNNRNTTGRWNNYTHNEGPPSQRNNGHNGGGGVMRPNNQFKPDRLSVHNRIDHSYLDQRRQPQQLQICAPPTHNFAQRPPPTVAPLHSNTQISAATLTAGVAASIANATDAAFVKHCIDAMPTVASKLLEQIDAMHRAKLEKKYDLKLQKEIAEVQGKQLMYTCPGAAVVSFDGPGIEVEPPQPHATETSMNQRFA